MIFILDTDVFTLAELPDSLEYRRLHARVAQLAIEDDVVTSVITYDEQTRGWMEYVRKSAEVAHQVRAYRLLKQHLLNYLKWTILDFSEDAAAEFERLRKLKIRIGTYDLKIAAIAIARNATFLSRNMGDFKRVPGLRVEDWTKP